MTIEDEITKAIGAHGTWKRRLQAAIDSGKADADPHEVAKENVCPFGQWLYGSTIPAAARQRPDYGTVRELHAKFHKCAASVLECVAQGQKAQATALMAGDYTKISADLTSAMMHWRTVSK